MLLFGGGFFPPLIGIIGGTGLGEALFGDTAVATVGELTTEGLEVIVRASLERLYRPTLLHQPTNDRAADTPQSVAESEARTAAGRCAAGRTYLRRGADHSQIQDGHATL